MNDTFPKRNYRYTIEKDNRYIISVAKTLLFSMLSMLSAYGIYMFIDSIARG